VTRRHRMRALVIDDSAFSRQTIIRMLEASSLVEVVAYARDGEEALKKALGSQLDLITLDLEMPRMDGFTFLRILMAHKPTPVIVISGRAGDQDVFRALELGAVDFVAKPTQRAAPELATIEHELIRKIHAVRELRMDNVKHRLDGVAPPRHDLAPRYRPKLVAIGSSTGGPAALMQLFAAFSAPPPFCFVVAQHMPMGFTRGFAERLDRLTALRAREAAPGEPIEAGTILVAPGGSHLEFELREGRVITRITPSNPGDRYAPSVDRLFISAAKHFGADVLAVVLTGMGDDGRRGVRTVKENGGNVIVESEETAVIFGMPQQALRGGAVDAVLPLPEIGAVLKADVGSSEATDTEASG
jgi:two-component system, chemotaxis family, protein-glutamate methylesterase/glutaminase